MAPVWRSPFCILFARPKWLPVFSQATSFWDVWLDKKHPGKINSSESHYKQGLDVAGIDPTSWWRHVPQEFHRLIWQAQTPHEFLVPDAMLD